MKTKLSTRGQVVVPQAIRQRLGLRAGDAFDADIEGGRIVLTPKPIRKRKAKIINDPVSGLPVISIGPDAPVLTSEEVRAIMSNFP